MSENSKTILYKLNNYTDYAIICVKVEKNENMVIRLTKQEEICSDNGIFKVHCSLYKSCMGIVYRK